MLWKNIMRWMFSAVCVLLLFLLLVFLGGFLTGAAVVGYFLYKVSKKEI